MNEKPKFKDYFSKQAAAYSKFRPNYPAELFSFLASLCKEHRTAWDCATGSGQSARGLVPHFDQIFATDGSAEQISHAFQDPKIKYSVALSEDSQLADSSIDLITVAAAIHWFDLEKFYTEVRRVLKPGGILAVWLYHGLQSDFGLGEAITKFEKEILGNYWPDAIYKWAWPGLSKLPFPFPTLETPSFAIHQTDTLDLTLGKLGTWSAAQRYIQEKGEDPRDLIKDELEEIFRKACGSIKTKLPLQLKVGRNPTLPSP